MRSAMFLLLILPVVTALNNRPIIGIMTQPHSTSQDSSYLAASYVKFLESAGARVVPVHYDSSPLELTTLFKQINGLVMPGGGADLANTTQMRRSGQVLYDLAVKANDAGDPFPIWGTCMGFQLLSLLTAQDDSILCHACFDSEGTPMPLDFSEPLASKSRLFGAMTDELKHKLSTENLTENSHHDGVPPSVFQSNQRLHQFYHVLSTNVDYTGAPFTSTIEAIDYPFAATQWHPEKNNFEWTTKLGRRAIPHSADAVLVSQYMANFVVNEARKSTHQFHTEEEEAAALIYNFPAVKDPAGYFVQIYVWG